MVGYSQTEDNQNVIPLKRDASLKQQLLIMKAGQDNPTRTAEIELDKKFTNERIISEVAYGPANDKVGIVVPDEKTPEKIAENSKINTTITPTDLKQSTGTQTMGAQPETKVDYHSHGGGNTQSDAKKSGREINYRSMKGSNEQPVGKKPE